MRYIPPDETDELNNTFFHLELRAKLITGYGGRR